MASSRAARANSVCFSCRLTAVRCCSVVGKLGDQLLGGCVQLDYAAVDLVGLEVLFGSVEGAAQVVQLVLDKTDGTVGLFGLETDALGQVDADQGVHQVAGLFRVGVVIGD